MQIFRAYTLQVCKKKISWLTKQSFYIRRFEFQFPKNTELCELREKKLIRDKQHGVKSTVKRGSEHVTCLPLSSDFSLWLNNGN